MFYAFGDVVVFMGGRDDGGHFEVFVNESAFLMKMTSRERD